MATISKRGDRWSVQIRRAGAPAQYKTFSNKSDARAWATLEEARIEQGQSPIPLRLLRATKLGDVVDRYLAEVTPTKRSAETEKLRLEKIKRDEICAVTLDRLASSHIAAYRDRRLLVVKPGTVRRELSLLNHMLDLARKEWGIRLARNPVADVAQPTLHNARNRRLNHGELERLTAACRASRNRLLERLVLFAIETAMRRGEILALEWRHIDLEARTAHIPQTKTGKPRTIPLTDGAIAILRGRKVEGGERPFPLSANALKLAWARAVRRAKLVDLRFHDLRHEGVSRFFELGLSLPEVAIVSGHRDPRMLFRYTHLRPVDLARKLSGMRWQAPGAGCEAGSAA